MAHWERPIQAVAVVRLNPEAPLRAGGFPNFGRAIVATDQHLSPQLQESIDKTKNFLNTSDGQDLNPGFEALIIMHQEFSPIEGGARLISHDKSPKPKSRDLRHRYSPEGVVKAVRQLSHLLHAIEPIAKPIIRSIQKRTPTK